MALVGQADSVAWAAQPARSAIEPLALLLLPARLEQFELEQHARALLKIPRVIALEASRRHAPRWLQDSADARAARRLRLPGALRLLVLYHPRQYPLARALRADHDQAELWYLASDPEVWRTRPGPDAEDLRELDQLARENARATLGVTADGVPDERLLRERLAELGVISARAFVPSARFSLR